MYSFRYLLAVILFSASSWATDGIQAPVPAGWLDLKASSNLPADAPPEAVRVARRPEYVMYALSPDRSTAMAAVVRHASGSMDELREDLVREAEHANAVVVDSKVEVRKGLEVLYFITEAQAPGKSQRTILCVQPAEEQTVGLMLTAPADTMKQWLPTYEQTLDRVAGVAPLKRSMSAGVFWLFALLTASGLLLLKKSRASQAKMSRGAKRKSAN